MVLTIPRHLRACRNRSLKTCCLQQEVDNLVARDSDIVSAFYIPSLNLTDRSQVCDSFCLVNSPSTPCRKAPRQWRSTPLPPNRLFFFCFLSLVLFICYAASSSIRVLRRWVKGVRGFFFNVSWDGFAISVLFFSWAQCLSWLLFQDVNAV